MPIINPLPKPVTACLYGVLSVLLSQIPITTVSLLPYVRKLQSETLLENRSVKLVLNTLGKMHKTEFCLNIYTDGRNTNLEVMYDSEVITSQETIQSYAELLPADGKTYSKRYTGPSDRPDEDFGIVYITKYDDSLVIIRAFTFSKGRTYTRAKNNTWKGWVKGIASDDFSDQTVIGNRGVVTTNASQPLGLYINTDQKKISLYINSSLIGSFNYT